MARLLPPQRLQRLREIAQDEGVVFQEDKSTLTPPNQRPTFRVPDDDRKADAVLGQMRIEAAQSRPQPSGFKRAFSASKKPETSYTPKELHEALTRVVDDNGLAGVAEVLLSRFHAAGGNSNYSRRASNGLVKKITNANNQDERGRLLQTATELCRLDFVQLLAPHADSPSLDESLRISLNHKNTIIIETLIRYGANASLYQAAFQNAAENDESEILDTFIRALKRVPPQCVTQSLLTATIAGSLQAVLLLVRAGANCEYDDASALLCAVQTSRIDIILAMILGPNPPSPQSLDRALNTIFSSPTVNMGDKHLLVEILLCGGPLGNAANDALFKATFLVDEEMMQLLLEYGADINYNNACAVAHAVQRSRTDLVSHLLRNQDLRPDFASEVVGRIARTAPSSVKVSIMSMLLVQGASGHNCNDLLVTAVEQDDIDTAQLLLSYGKDQNRPPVVSAGYNDAQSLQIAVARGNLPLVKSLVSEGNPSSSSLSKAFPMIPKDNQEILFLIAQILLQAGAEGPEVDLALHSVVTGQQRSPRLVDLFVKNGVRVTGQTLISIVTQGRVDILEVLVSGNTSPVACSAAITVGMKHIKLTRYRVIELLLHNATLAGPESSEISQALVDLLQNSPEDCPLLKLLCFKGKADINFQLGQAVLLATENIDPAVLEIVLQSTGPAPTASTIASGLGCAMNLDATDESRHGKVQALLKRNRPQDAMNQALVQEIQGALRQERDLSVLKTLLAHGADVNFQEGAPVCYAVRSPGIMDIILARHPSPHSLSKAFILAMHIPEPARYSLCEKLIKAGAIGPEISRALYKAVKEGQPALNLIKLLLEQADVNHHDGRILKTAVRGIFYDGVDLLLSHRPVMATLDTKKRAFQEAMGLAGTQDRFDMVRKLLEAGTKGDIISDALITAANWKDLLLTELLLQSGASVDWHGGKAIHSAASSGSIDILQVLVCGKISPKPTLSNLTAGFGGAMSLKEKDRDAYYSILQVLLFAGMKGEAVDAALVDAVIEGDSNIRLIELIYSSGASIEWNEGEALEIAAKSASMITLNLLLQAKPSQNVMRRAYRSGLGLQQREQRYSVIENILKAGKSIDKHVTNTLFKATHENPPDRQLIRLLLEYQVFDLGESMAHSSDVLDIETLSLLTSSPKANPFIPTIFGDVVATEKPWQSKKGIAIAELLLERGVIGEVVGDTLVKAVERCEAGPDPLASEFLDVLIRFKADVNHQRGLPLQRAAQRTNVDLIQKLIPGATADSKAMAMYYLFSSPSDEAKILQMIENFTDATDAERRLDIDFRHPDPELEPVLFMALRQYPRKTQVLKALLDNGFSPNQWQVCEIEEDLGEEAYSVLCWAIAQPEKRISSANIEILVESGANVSFASKSGINPVMLSIKNQRPDILEMLISKGAKVTSPVNGVTPLALASRVGNSAVMAHLLKAGAEIDDGSLHDAARGLRCEAMRVLIRYNHEVDFPSDRHDGRSALAELCLRAVDNGPSPVMEEAIEILIANGADIRLRYQGGKTIFHYALDSSDPLTVLRILLKLLWKFINEDAFLFDDGQHTYSLTKYVEKGLSLGPEFQRMEIVDLLHQKRVIDKFWANDLDVPQPSDLCGAPKYIIDEANRQKARARLMSEQLQEAQHQLELKRLVATEETKILRDRTDAEIRIDLEKARMQDRILETRADQQLRLDARAELERQRLASVRQGNELSHAKAIGAEQVRTQRLIGEARIQNEQTEHMLAIEYVEARIAKENDGVRGRLAIENSGREDAERIENRIIEKQMAKLNSQKKLVDANTALAGRLQSGGMNQRQIGYITGEVN